MRKKIAILLVLPIVFLAVVEMRGVFLKRWTDTTGEEMAVLASTMQWTSTRSVAEIGAGQGSMTMSLAHMAPGTAQIYATEIEPALVAALRKKAAQDGFTNVSVVQGSDHTTGLPDQCCDAIYMRRVYHHFNRPSEMDAALYRALRSDGLLAIADFTPNALDWFAAAVKRHPVDGIDRSQVERQLTAAGFVPAGEVAPWPGRGYCLLFRKVRLASASQN
jgi:ubiquinone/menaquinone biosynthesis C-methylase UbiE